MGVVYRKGLAVGVTVADYDFSNCCRFVSQTIGSLKKVPPARDVVSYIAAFPPTTRALLRQLRALIRETAPDAEEKISYGMPGYKYHGMLFYFAGYEKHIGFYPGAQAIEHFQGRLTRYKTSKGTIQFLLDATLPIQLIRDIVKWRIRENKTKLSGVRARRS